NGVLAEEGAGRQDRQQRSQQSRRQVVDGVVGQQGGIQDGFLIVGRRVDLRRQRRLHHSLELVAKGGDQRRKRAVKGQHQQQRQRSGCQQCEGEATSVVAKSRHQQS